MRVNVQSAVISRTFLLSLPLAMSFRFKVVKLVPRLANVRSFVNKNVTPLTIPGTNILPAPAANKTLKYLALGRGILTYSCHGRKSYETPLYVSQDTSLWDAAPLIPRIANEELFHTIIPQLYEFDYTKLANSTLVCIGFINTLQGTAVADLFNVGAIAISVQEKINSPQLPTLNLEWAHEVSTDAEWDVYRVETVGGRAPATCAGEEGDFQTDYAAEYWFYHE